MGLVSVRDEDRQVARTWFETVLSATDCRSVRLIVPGHLAQLSACRLFPAIEWLLIEIVERPTSLAGFTELVGMDRFSNRGR